MHQFFICNQDEVDSKLATLTKTGTSDDGWTDYYIDKNSNEEWLLTRYNSECHGGGVPVLKRLPKPTIEQLIDIALTSPDKNDIIGASLELSEREKYHKDDFRNKLIERLLMVDTSRLTEFEKERLKIIVYESDLYDSTNRRDIVGKHFTEIENDADYYRTISQKAKGILNDIEKYSS
jgi:immunity protein 27 of polymorphic toxin system